MAKKNWTVAASTGTADEESREFLVFGRVPAKQVIAQPGTPSGFTSSQQFGTGDSVVSLVDNAKKGRYSLRYHVPLEPIEIRDDFQVMEVRYWVDDLDSGRVVVLLKKYSLVSPVPEERAEILSVFDSNDHAASDSFQLQSVRFDDDLDDPEFAYFIEVLLINGKDPSPIGPAAGGGVVSVPDGTRPSPAIAAIRLGTRIT